MNRVAPHHIIERELAHVQEQLDELVNAVWPPDVRIVLRCLHARLFEADLTIGRALVDCGIHSGHFPTRFKYHCRTTLRRYVEDRRMMAAMRLLTFVRLDVQDIALSVGYDSYRSFARAFKRYLGYTPSAFRRRIVSDGNYVPSRVQETVFRRLVTA